jgi:pre-60S factor REI1
MDTTTCTACRVVISSGPESKLHYKSEFHTYNLKRKQVNLEPVSLEIFQEKKSQNSKLAPQTIEIKCPVCNSLFRSQEKFEKHSHSHQTSDQDRPLIPFHPEQTCLFCTTHSEDVQLNLRHMLITHGFFIPDIEFIKDLTVFLTYLHERIRIGLLCLYCNNKGCHQFREFRALQQHMTVKQHCFLNTEEDEEEYEEFYEFQREECMELALGKNEIMHTGELRLENGSIVGCKEYRRYYKQYYRPRNQRHADLLRLMAEEYRKMPVETCWKTTDDLKAKESYKQRRELVQGLKNNMLKHHFRRQVPI